MKKTTTKNVLWGIDGYGRKERITLNMTQEHINYLKSKDVSYSKTIARLIEKERKLTIKYG